MYKLCIFCLKKGWEWGNSIGLVRLLLSEKNVFMQKMPRQQFCGNQSISWNIKQHGQDNTIHIP